MSGQGASPVPDGVTTSKKLWLGFGTLIALLMLVVLTLIVRLRSIEAQVGGMASAGKLSAEAGHLRINLLEYALNVRTYLLLGDPKASRDAFQAAADVERHLRAYELLATTVRQHEMSARFGLSWQELKELGQGLLLAEGRSPKPGDSEKFYELRRGLESLLDDELQAEAVGTYTVREEATLREVRNILGLALTLLVVGGVIALVTSGAVARGVVKGEGDLWASGERLRVTLASIGDAVITTDIHGHVTYLNPVAEALTGWKGGEAAGQPLDAVFRIANEETRRPVESPATRALREGLAVSLAGRTVLIARDGTERPVDDSAAPIRDQIGEVAGVVLIFRDVTERRNAERALSDRERRFREMIDALPAAIYTTDAQGRLTHFNPAAAAFSGRIPELGTDQWCVTWKLYRPDGTPLPHDECPMAIALKEGRIVGGAECIAERPDGTRLWFTPYPTPLRDAEGRVIGGINMLVDITDRKQAEAALREADRRKDEFLATLSHELRNPLAPIRNAVHILHLEESPPPELKWAREVIDRQVQQMTRLVDDLLDVARITTGKLGLRKGRVDLARIVRGAVETSSPLIEECGHELRVTLPPQPVMLDADLTRLAQALANLLNNAAKYTEAGGRIDLTVAPRENEVLITIKDTGTGISAEVLPHIFEMFTQGDPSSERSQSGLGVGLKLVQSLVEQHGGSVSARSEGPGRGSEFVVRLPILVEDPSPGPEPVAGGAEPTTRRRILVVDDNRDSATSLALMLNLLGHDTQTAHDGLEAVEAAATFRPDVVLLDIGLPKLNGYEAARKMREQPGGQSMMLVAVTGWGQDEDRRRTNEAGFDRHLIKPVDSSALTRLLTDSRAAV